MISSLGDAVYSAGSRTGVVTTVNDPLNLRATASATGQVLTTIPKGGTVSIIGETASWFNVTYNGKMGYASKQFIKETPYVPPVVAASPSPSGAPMLVDMRMPDGADDAITGGASGAAGGGALILGMPPLTLAAGSLGIGLAAWVAHHFLTKGRR